MPFSFLSIHSKDCFSCCLEPEESFVAEKDFKILIFPFEDELEMLPVLTYMHFAHFELLGPAQLELLILGSFTVKATQARPSLADRCRSARSP